MNINKKTMMEKINFKIDEPTIYFDSAEERNTFMEYYNLKRFGNDDVKDLVDEGECVGIENDGVYLEGCFTANDLCLIERDFNGYVASVEEMKKTL